MTPAFEQAVMVAALVFCRVGSCLMLVPGMSSARIPILVRLLVALAVAAALTPLLWPLLAPLARLNTADLPVIMLAELLAGLLIGTIARFFLLAVQFAATFAANVIGLAGIPGIPLEDSEALVPLAAIMSLSATMAMLAAGLHLEIIRALIESYAAVPPGGIHQPEWYLDAIVTALSATSMLALRLAAPFAIYAITVNLALGFASKFAPQMQVYFVSTGLVMMGGLMVMWLLAPDWLQLFTAAYGDWLRAGTL